MALLEVRNIKKKFGENEILKGISFDIEKGEVLSIIGSSGSGKTTLLRCLNFLEIADEGTIKVADELIFEGKSEKKYKDDELRKKRLNFGLVFQSFNLFPQYTASQNVALALKLQNKENVKKYKAKLKEELKGVAKENKKDTKKANAEKVKAYKDDLDKSVDEVVNNLLEQVGLSERKGFYPHQLSGGQQQRVAIARALALNPKILCFDEPTSALDPELTGEVLKVIKGLKTSGRTMIVVTHEMEFAKNVSDKVMFMADGVIEEMNSPDEIFNNPKSEKLQNFLKKSFEEI
ncbi:MAG: amino acid ABC transporter ATP-binding protein [Clostridia bacterium]|nr:amino acid ABC transporter ATP-binding protein [Clostridia bacterium]MDY5263562.1 amino acid ABC transporter ATP-binding protein [Eubacteriales bacterium]